MKKAILVLTILFCCIFNVVAQEEIESEEYEVYKVWLNKILIKPDTKQIVIMKFIADHRDDFTYLPRAKRRKLSQLQFSTLKNYRLRNRKTPELRNDFGVTPIINFITREEFLFFLGSYSAAEEFAKKFGAEYRISFSRVGFNKRKNQAMLHVDFRSNLMRKYAYGYYFLYQKDGGNWILKQYVKSWEY